MTDKPIFDGHHRLVSDQQPYFHHLVQTCLIPPSDLVFSVCEKISYLLTYLVMVLLETAAAIKALHH